jgi:hypothetical protein
VQTGKKKRWLPVRPYPPMNSVVAFGLSAVTLVARGLAARDATALCRQHRWSTPCLVDALDLGREPPSAHERPQRRDLGRTDRRHANAPVTLQRHPHPAQSQPTSRSWFAPCCHWSLTACAFSCLTWTRPEAEKTPSCAQRQHGGYAALHWPRKPLRKDKPAQGRPGLAEKN